MQHTRPHVLLTNDDGIDSPFFATAIEQLRALADLSIVVPASEQSWKGKSMTRVGTIHATQTEVAGHPAYAVTGTPADCVSLGVHNLLNRRPDLVVSGINVGMNAGLGFVMASGTVGACLEGNIAGIPGIALSQLLPPEVFRNWDTNRGFEDPVTQQLKTIAAAVIPVLWRNLVTDATNDPITWNVNLPYELTDPTPVRTFLGHSYYQRVFEGDDEGGYQHRLRPFARDEHPESDYQVLRRGQVSATLLDMRTFGTL